jgi:hypothetical protein
LLGQCSSPAATPESGRATPSQVDSGKGPLCPPSVALHCSCVSPSSSYGALAWRTGLRPCQPSRTSAAGPGWCWPRSVTSPELVRRRRPCTVSGMSVRSARPVAGFVHARSAVLRLDDLGSAQSRTLPALEEALGGEIGLVDDYDWHLPVETASSPLPVTRVMAVRRGQGLRAS